MLEEMYNVLNGFRENITPLLDDKIIYQREKECGVVFPEGMKDFYRYFGNDKSVLSSYYEIDEIQDVRIENDALTFGYKHQGVGRLGITLEHLNSKYQAISWYSDEWKQWFGEGAVFPETYFFNMACWQVLNTMSAIVKVTIVEEDYNKLVENHFTYFSSEKIYINGYNISSIYTKDVLGCYVQDDEELFLGTNKDDEVLERLENNLKLDFDWL